MLKFIHEIIIKIINSIHLFLFLFFLFLFEMFPVDDTPESIIARIIPRNKMNLAGDRDINHYYLKIFGFMDYLVGNYKMIEYKHIRQALEKGSKVEISLVHKDELPTNIELPEDVSITIYIFFYI